MEQRWWRGGLDATAAATTSVSCSASGSSLKARSCDEPAGSASGSSVTFQDAHHKDQNQDHMIAGQLIESSMQIPTFGLSPSTMDWTHPLLRSSGRAETSYHAMLQDDLSSRPFDSSANPFLLDQHHHLSSGEQGDFGLAPESYGCSSTIVQGLYESDAKQERSIYNYQPPLIEYRGSTSIDLPPQTPWLKSPEQQSSTNQLQFSNNTSFWNPPAAAASSELGFYAPIHGQFASHIIEQKPSSSNLIAKSNAEGARESATKKKSSSESTFKKPRMETPSPLPSFKVRKEKLGDRITALQQLVSPFGKTDTASVLHEAIEYIKFLHDQVSVLSTPYLKNGNPMQQQQNSGKSKDGEGTKQDLRSRGLCLVPIASTYPVASESPADFWTPNFGGTYR